MKTFIFIFLGYSFTVLMNLSGGISLIIFPIYILFSITFFIQLIYFNVISFILILICIGYKQFILRFRELDDIYLRKVIFIMYNFLLTSFSISYQICKKELNNLHFSMKKGIKVLVFFPYLILTNICFFFYNIFINIFFLIINLIVRRNFNSFFNDLEKVIEDTI